MNIDLVADYMIMKGNKPNGEALTQLGLQKLVYLCQGWHLALADGELFREDIYAYEFGPVVRELRHRFRFLGANPLPMMPITDAERVLSAGAKRVIDDVWSHYGKMPTSALVDLTHAPGSPWSQVWNSADAEERENLHIPQALIRDWFKVKLAEKLRPRRTRKRDVAFAFESFFAAS
ncbi:hypothetical protein A6A04_13540 [Paramagnetospirillum marisnigri]|uniref:Antitoxin SocA-like Panacea domain-containing protein n=1 Tax=Paramagnetospirillum marisnigri TaxID=1285242 RepID=A0A178MUU0_9PROT|nr:type II toxin-antitoxin system antitoxin SocA domain-containing protein [Paramagnetospirillum marisnigri]OAN53909.1 hypothetical protein A6A04_13540 [Paramagnetospirillum marisnigri]